MNTAEYIVKKLEELGVNEIFGVAGDYNFNILYSIENNSQSKFIGCTNELNAGYAADGYARIRGYGAVVTTYGVGELSTINAIAGANAENVPVVNIVGLPSTECVEKRTLMHHNFQDVNYNAFIDSYKSVTSAVTFLSRDNAKMEIDRVFKTLVKEKRPVYIALPMNIAMHEISDKYVSYDWISDQDNLRSAGEKIVSKINKSKHPVIIGDILIKRFDALLEYKEFVSKTGIPVTNFLMGANLIDADYDKYLGGYFGELRNPIAEKYLKDSDCRIYVGVINSDLNSFGKNPSKDINKEIAVYGTYTYIEGKKYDDVKMSELLDYVIKNVESKEIEIEKPNIGYKVKQTEKEPLTTAYIYPRIQEFLKENDIIFAETGTVPQGISLIKFPNNVNVQFQILWGSIGWATPAALGACMAKPQARVILITGDGAHQMSALEVGNMIRYKTKPVVIVLNNKGYMIERVLSNNVNDSFNDIVQMNYAKFARTFEGDIWATKVDTTEDFDKALKVTQIMNKMCYIEACTSKLDMPKLTQDFVSQLKGHNIDIKEETEKFEVGEIEVIDDIKIEEKPHVFEAKKIEEVLPAISSYNKYETVVHKSLNEDMFGDEDNE